MTDKITMYVLKNANSAEHLVRDAVVLSIITAECSATDSISDVFTSDRADLATLAEQSL